MDVEAVILGGGSSRRMGSDKAAILVNGEPMIERLVRLLTSAGYRCTVLGPQGTADREPGSGPLRALADFSPSAPWVFVCACDLPRFDPVAVRYLRSKAEGFDAVIPVIGGKPQPLAALYSAEAQKAAKSLDQSERRIMAWIQLLHAKMIEDAEMTRDDVSPKFLTSANTREEWERLLAESPI